MKSRITVIVKKDGDTVYFDEGSLGLGFVTKRTADENIHSTGLVASGETDLGELTHLVTSMISGVVNSVDCIDAMLLQRAVNHVFMRGISKKEKPSPAEIMELAQIPLEDIFGKDGVTH